MTKRIQLALQGGGAKVVGLIAAMQAVEDLQNRKIIEITRVAGTSAGSIVGGLFCAGVPMATVRNHLLNRSAELLQSFSLPHPLLLALRVIRGVPIWSQRIIEAELETLLRPNARDGSTLGNLSPKLRASATDLDEMILKVMEGNDSLIRSMLHSSAIPFAFRGHKDEWLVDGGLCENLPATFLEGDVTEFGPVVALGFAPEYPRMRQHSLLEYCKSMLLAAMNNSVARAKDKLGGSCIEINIAVPRKESAAVSENAYLSTFGFALALGDGLSEQYFDLTKGKAKDDLEAVLEKMDKAANQSAKLTDEAWEAPDATNPVALRQTILMADLGEIYRFQHASQPINYEKCSIEVIAYSANPATPESLDEITTTTDISALKDPIYCHKIVLPNADYATSLEDSDLRVLGSNALPIKKVFKLPITDHADKLVREVLLFFVPPLRVGDEPYRIIHKTKIRGYLRALSRPSGTDFMAIWPTREGSPMSEAEIVLALPGDSDTFHFTVSHGESMPASEIKGMVARMPPGFAVFGFRARDVKHEECLKVDIRRV